MITSRHSSGTLNRRVEFAVFPRRVRRSDSRKAIHRARKNAAVIHAPRTPRVCTITAEGDAGDVCRWPVVLPFPYRPREVYSEAVRHDVQHPRRAPERFTVITILHVTLSAHPTNERRRIERRGKVQRETAERRRTEEDEEDVD